MFVPGSADKITRLKVDVSMSRDALIICYDYAQCTLSPSVKVKVDLVIFFFTAERLTYSLRRAFNKI